MDGSKRRREKQKREREREREREEERKRGWEGEQKRVSVSVCREGERKSVCREEKREKQVGEGSSKLLPSIKNNGRGALGLRKKEGERKGKIFLAT